MALCIPIENRWTEGRERTELKKMEDIRKKLLLMRRKLLWMQNELDDVNDLVSELIRKERESKLWTDGGNERHDDPEDDVEAGFDFNFDFDKDDDCDYDPDEVYTAKFDYGGFELPVKDCSKEPDEETEFDDEPEINPWSGWDKEEDM